MEKGQETKQHASSAGTSQAREDQPLLRALDAERLRRGETLAQLARHLGVTYERLSQWRRDAAQIGKAHRSVHEKAAKYLGCPTMLVLVMSGFVGLDEFVWPAAESLETRISSELRRMALHPYLGAFVPVELGIAPAALKMFVLFLFRELEGKLENEKPAYQWLRAMHLAANGDAAGQLEVAKLREKAQQDGQIF